MGLRLLVFYISLAELRLKAPICSNGKQEKHVAMSF